MEITKLNEPSQIEVRLVDDIREAFVIAYKTNLMTQEEIGDRLGLVPEGVEVLSRRKWPVDVAFRIAEALEIEIEFKVAKSKS